MVTISRDMAAAIIDLAHGYEGLIRVYFGSLDSRCSIAGERRIMREFAAELGRNTVPIMQEFVDIMSTWNEHPTYVSLGYINDILVKQD